MHCDARLAHAENLVLFVASVIEEWELLSQNVPIYIVTDNGKTSHQQLHGRPGLVCSALGTCFSSALAMLKEKWLDFLWCARRPEQFSSVTREVQRLQDNFSRSKGTCI
ncbi:hypothetical protein HPB47_012353 [Ixodes persulcatus]|uniref:Uncharacterized protein n=1 Tax=Ixodes persulcatus TaxID=34615 RepID=A0AC60NTS7_IXOPE|nr:hypothetical protein HPB47_012353 [Ixodes persulcatus]